MLLCAPCDRSGRLAWPDVAPGLTPDSIQQKYAQALVSARIVPGCVQFLGEKNVLTQPGSSTVLTAPKHHFRSAPVNGHRQTGPVGPAGAMSGSRRLDYSTTSSARATKTYGIVRPRVLAVFRFTTKSNLVGCSTGVSAGFAPFKTLSTMVAVRR
jgi:hypothetical protein